MTDSVMADGYEFKAFKYSSHFWIAELVERERKKARILDVGTAGGYLGKMLSAQGHSLTGVEQDAAEAERAKAYYDRFHNADIEKFAFPYRQEFDFILFGDVLEHLRDPASVLRKCLPALKETGKIIVSVPNVANLAVRLGLLLGRFDYTERGILDKTHLRFFTLRSLKKMMAGVPCTILEIIPTPLPVQLVFPFTESGIFAPLHEAHYALTRFWKTLFAYQFVTAVEPCRSQFVPDATEMRRAEGAAQAK